MTPFAGKRCKSCF